MSFPGYAADSLFQHLRCGTRDGLGEGCLMVSAIFENEAISLVENEAT